MGLFKHGVALLSLKAWNPGQNDGFQLCSLILCIFTLKKAPHELLPSRSLRSLERSRPLSAFEALTVSKKSTFLFTKQITYLLKFVALN